MTVYLKTLKQTHITLSNPTVNRNQDQSVTLALNHFVISVTVGLQQFNERRSNKALK